jgi:hypothetical protein
MFSEIEVVELVTANEITDDLSRSWRTAANEESLR